MSLQESLCCFYQDLIPQKVTSSDPWEGTALSEMVEHYLNTVKEGKTGAPEEKKQAEGPPPGDTVLEEGKKEEKEKKVKKKEKKEPASVKSEVPREEVQTETKEKPKKGAKRKGGEVEGGTPKEPSEVGALKQNSIQESAGVEKEKKCKKDKNSDGKVAENAALPVKDNEAVEEASRSKKKKSKKAESVEVAAAATPDLQISKKKNKKKSSN